MKFTKRYETESDYTSAKPKLILPNVSLVSESSKVYYNPKASIVVGTYLYDDGTTGPTPNSNVVGVCVIPNGLLPDRKARFMSVKGVNSNNTTGGNDEGIMWSSNYTKTVLPTQYNSAVCVRPNGDTQAVTDIIDHDSKGKNVYMPSDKTTGTYEEGTGLTNPFDSVNKINLKYAYADDGGHYPPSPYYSNGTLNSNYIATKNSNGDSITNALSDIDGYTNTQILIEDADVVAAKHCGVFAPNNYGQGKWYLPAIGELAFIMPRWNEIQAALGSVDGGVQLGSGDVYWSSTEYDSSYAWGLSTSGGNVSDYDKNYGTYVRAFLVL